MAPVSTLLDSCLQRQRRNVVDLEMQSHVTDLENEGENGTHFPTTNTNISPVENENNSVVEDLDSSQSSCYLKIFLNFCYFMGVSPFRVVNCTLKSCWVNKVTSIIVTLLAMICAVFHTRRLAWNLDEQEDNTGDQKALQQDKASNYIGLTYQFCLLILDICIFRMMWCSRRHFMKLFTFLKLQEIPTTFKSSLAHAAVLFVSISITIPISLICTVGGLDFHMFENWSFTNILAHKESVLLLGLKKSYGPDTSSNVSSGANGTFCDDEYMGLFMSDGHLETIVLGSIGIVLNYCQHLLSLVSYDCLLISAITLWVCTKSLREKLEQWGERNQRLDSEPEMEASTIVLVLVKQHEQLSLLSKQVNAITSTILPSLVFINIISMAYFMLSCVIRDWYFALFLALKLSKACVAVYFALKTSNVAEQYFHWFISKDVQHVLKLDSTEFQRTTIELKETPIGIGGSVFYIDIRFLLSLCVGVRGKNKAQQVHDYGKRSSGKA
ncbi:unnamed protein product [Orchesella dallaii]|uniref:Gustatory receptor n=1 Tax=Orchesella dallaii TaxID=48710 RepID=A0ABP1S967_9HEXA